MAKQASSIQRMSNNSSYEVMEAFIEGFLLGQRPGAPNVNATMAMYLFRRRHSCSTAEFRAAYARIREQRKVILGIDRVVEVEVVA